MATRSFTDTYLISKRNINTIHDVIVNPKSVNNAKRIANHDDVKGHEISKILGIKNKKS